MDIHNQIIIYPNETGGVCLCYPADCGIPVSEIARKDVPKGVPFLIATTEQVPSDHTFFAAFEADFSNPHGYGIGSDEWYAEQATKEQSQ